MKIFLKKRNLQVILLVVSENYLYIFVHNNYHGKVRKCLSV